MNGMARHAFEVNPHEVSVAHDCEANRAEREGFTGVRDSQRAVALHIRNAVHTMQGLCPPDYRVRTRLVFDIVPNVNPVLRDDVREGRS